jgi:hypothetical protein
VLKDARISDHLEFVESWAVFRRGAIIMDDHSIVCSF